MRLPHRRGVFRTLVADARAQGLASLYRGLLPTLLGILPYAAISFSTSERLKQAVRETWGEVRAGGGAAGGCDAHSRTHTHTHTGRVRSCSCRSRAQSRACSAAAARASLGRWPRTPSM